MSESLRRSSGVPRWHLVLIASSVLAIAVYLYLIGVALPWQRYATLPLLIVLVLGGLPLVVQILLKLVRGNLGADLLAVIALITAAWMHEYVTAVLVIFMLASGQTLEAFAMGKASDVLRVLAKRMPSIAHRKKADSLEDIPLLALELGDEIVIYPHETAPVDGVIIDGHGSMNESYLTGEPYQVSKAPGSRVLSGAINGDSSLVIRTEALPADSRYAKIMTVMEAASLQRPSLQRLGDQIGIIFAPLALTVAGLAWGLSGEPLRFLSVLTIATPCPLLIAIPITVISAISKAAKCGIIIRDPTVLERLPTCRTAIFDKTGTLTYGQPELTDIIVAEGYKPDRMLQYTASLERYSKHPLSTAVLEAAQTAKLYLPDVTTMSEKPGQGLSGTVDGHELLVTSRKKLQEAQPEVLANLPAIQSGLECVLLLDGLYAATFRFHDAPRVESESFIRHLAPSHHFNKVMLVSGDRESEVSYLAQLVGIHDIRASQSPEQKLAIVREEVAKAPTLFMGDGVNDAPALVVATVGLAFGQHTDVAAEAAGAVILDNTLFKVDELFHLSQDMRRLALQSALGGMALSLVGMGFAAMGSISPVTGALLQEMIDVLAILNALRLAWGNRVQTDIVQ